MMIWLQLNLIIQKLINLIQVFAPFIPSFNNQSSKSDESEDQETKEEEEKETEVEEENEEENENEEEETIKDEFQGFSLFLNT